MSIIPYSSNCQIIDKTLYYIKREVGDFGKIFRVKINKD